MSALEASIENLGMEHTALTQKLAQIDQDYRVERPVIVGQLNQLAKALSALTGKPVAGASGLTGRKPMSEEGKAAIKAGLEKARAAKAAGVAQGPVAVPAKSTVETDIPAPTSAEMTSKKSPATDKGATRGN